MKDRRHLLKIKLKSLAAESRIIRDSERRLTLRISLPDGAEVEKMFKETTGDKSRARWLRNWKRAKRAELRAKSWYNENRQSLEELHIHRTLHLRRAARASYLAYGFIRGRTLEQMEGPRRPATHEELKVFEEAARMAYSYGPLGMSKSDSTRDFYQWVKSRQLMLTYDDGWPKLSLAIADADDGRQHQDHHLEQQHDLASGEGNQSPAAIGNNEGQPALPSAESQEASTQ